MEKQLEEKNTEMGNVISRSEEFIQKNQKIITIVVVAIVIVVLAIFGLRKWVFQPRENRAAEEMFAAEQWFAQGDWDKALNGDDTYRGFVDIAGKYGSTKAGNLARYYAGISYLRMGDFDQAKHWLKKYNGKDTFTRPLAVMAEGDAEMELGNTQKAVDLYMKAANMEHNYITAPSALFKAGMGYLMIGQNNKAAKCFEQIKTDYPESTERQEADKYLGIAEAAK